MSSKGGVGRDDFLQGRGNGEKSHGGNAQCLSLTVDHARGFSPALFRAPVAEDPFRTPSCSGPARWKRSPPPCGNAEQHVAISARANEAWCHHVRGVITRPAGRKKLDRRNTAWWLERKAESPPGGWIFHVVLSRCARTTCKLLQLSRHGVGMLRLRARVRQTRSFRLPR
jgi:hypothetical protein